MMFNGIVDNIIIMVRLGISLRIVHIARRGYEGCKEFNFIISFLNAIKKDANKYIVNIL